MHIALYISYILDSILTVLESFSGSTIILSGGENFILINN